MKIRALTYLYGPEISARAGDIVEVDETVGRQYIAAGAATEIPAPPEKIAAPESAALVSPPEQTTLPSAKPRRVEAPPEAP